MRKTYGYIIILTLVSLMPFFSNGKELPQILLKEESREFEPLPFPFSVSPPSGFLKSEFACRVVSSTEWTKMRNIFQTSLRGELFENIKFKFTGRAFYDAVFALTNNFSSGVKDDHGHEICLREAFLDFPLGGWDFRIGKQQIVWGEAVGIFLADIVNAKDLREFILPDFDFIRLSQWAVNAEYYLEKFHFELIWQPILEFNELGVPGSEFALSFPPKPLPYIITETDTPANSLKNGEAGIRLSHSAETFDTNLFYLYCFEDNPIWFRSIASTSAGATSFVNLRYKRQHQIGLTFSKELIPFMVRGEFLYTTPKYLSVLDATDEDGVIKKEILDYVLGMDYTFFKKVDFNMQFVQHLIFNYDSRLPEDQTTSYLSLRAAAGFLNNAIEPEVFFMSNLSQSDYLFRPKVKFNVNDAWQVNVGGDFFGGKTMSFFGQFKDRDRVYLEAKYAF
ncbi:MAG: hypothetical protein KAS99_04080 [Candidatus Omnitrophica bacterium]|nr:hypothetical protein [Candidatus Omnitrophota bacterium]